MELGDVNTCRKIRCGHFFAVDGAPGCDKQRMHEGLFSCREFDIAAERREAGLS